MAEGFFRAGADPASPDSYQQLELRKRIAMAMLGQSGRKGYPKNLGEGLTAIGDAIGDRSQMQQLMAAQRSEDARRAAIPSMFPAPVPGAGSAPAAVVPGAGADAAPPAAAAPVQTAAAEPDWLSGAQVALPPPQQPQQAAEVVPPPEGGGDLAYPQTASLTSPDTASDAPPVGIQQAPPAADPGVRNALAQQVMQQQRPGVAPQNPLLGGGQSPAAMPSTFSPEDLGSPPEAAANRPIVADIATPPRATEFSAQSRQPSEAPPPVYKEPLPPRPPDRTPESREQRAFTMEAIRRRSMGEDPAIVDYLERQAGELEKDRAQKDAIKLKEYESERAKHNTVYEQWKTQQTPKWQAEQALELERANIVRRTGQTPEQFYPRMDKERDIATQAVKAQDAQQLARKAMREGVITGYGANFKVAADKFATWALKNGMGPDLAANTETMSAALKAGLSEAIQTINGAGGVVSNSDLLIAQGMQGSDPNLQMKTIQRLMDRSAEINNMKVNKYEDMVDKYLGGHPQELNYATNPRPVAPPDHINKLLTTPPEQSTAMRKFFDEVYGPGAAELEIKRHERRQRRSGG